MSSRESRIRYILWKQLLRDNNRIFPTILIHFCLNLIDCFSL